MIFKHDDTIKTVSIQCECWKELMQIVRSDWSDTTDYYINFYIQAFSSGQGLFKTLKERLKLAWLALRKGTYIHEEIIVNREILRELQFDIEELLKEPDISNGYKTTTI